MRKLISKTLLYLRLWFIRRMGYPLPSLREARHFVVPGKLYDHFAFVVRAVKRKQPLSKDAVQGTPEYCDKCDLFRHGIPCNFCHDLKDSDADICQTHVFQVICKNPDRI